ncbi:YbjQ family protein [Paracoccaceae bacterium GXU_MW_L88]
MTTSKNDILVVTSDIVPGREVDEALGLVRGTTVRARHVGADIVASVRSVFGGEISEYTAMVAGAREQALDRLRDEARALGANAVIAMRFESSSGAKGEVDVLVYGTAVRLK